MNKILQTFRYISKTSIWIMAAGIFTTVGSIAISYLVFYLTDQNRPRMVVSVTPPVEVLVGAFALTIGWVLFIPNFRVGLANGISRKTLLVANLFFALPIAVAFSIANTIIVWTYGLFLPISIISNLIYTHISWGELLVLQFTLYLLMIVSGWLIALAYYRSSKLMKWVLSFSPFIFLFILIQDNIRGGVITDQIHEYMTVTMLYPFRASATMFVYATILFGLIYLLFRRAPLKM